MYLYSYRDFDDNVVLSEQIIEYLNENYDVIEINFYETVDGPFGLHGFSISTTQFNLKISGFPGNCSWIVVSNLTSYRKEKLEIARKVATRYRYSTIFFSLNERQLDCDSYLPDGSELLTENINYHGGSRVYLYKWE